MITGINGAFMPVTGFGFLGQTLGINTGLFAAHASAMRAVHQQMEPMRRALEAIRKHMQQIVEAARASITAIQHFILSTWNWRPLIYVTPPASTVPNKRIDRHLDMSIDPHGYFIFGDKTLFKLHSRASRCGRFLHKLFVNISEVVSYEEIDEHIGAGDRSKTFKDLKYKLKVEGYQMEYVLVRTEGIALKGILVTE